MELTLNGARINYEREGAGIPVIFLHAGLADSRMWGAQADELARDFDVIRPDTRGFGRSEMPPGRWSPEADLLALIDELELKPAHLVGCSMGGGIAIDFALLHPERISKLVLVGAAVSGTHRTGQTNLAAAAPEGAGLRGAQQKRYSSVPRRAIPAAGHVPGRSRARA
jgi:pimeloyl-ACP methyl ester carboxylesterase